MDSKNLPTEQEVKDLRVAIDACVQTVESFSGSRSLALVKTKLEEAKMWSGKQFEEMGRELPKQFQDKAE